jgi:hypothetical protein
LLYKVNFGEGEGGFISEDFWLYSIACHDDALDALTEHPHEQGLTPHKLDVDSMSPPTGWTTERKCKVAYVTSCS